MSRSDQVYVSDILESAEIILKYVENKTKFEFAEDIMLQDAVIRRFEIIGEASSKISQDVKNKNPLVQWQMMKGMRNKLIHEYFGVSALTIYSTAKTDIAILKKQLINLVY